MIYIKYIYIVFCALTSLSFIYLIYINAGELDIPIRTMPGRYMLGWRHGLIKEVSVVSFDHQEVLSLDPQSFRAGAHSNLNNLVLSPSSVSRTEDLPTSGGVRLSYQNLRDYRTDACFSFYL